MNCQMQILASIKSCYLLQVFVTLLQSISTMVVFFFEKETALLTSKYKHNGLDLPNSVLQYVMVL